MKLEHPIIWLESKPKLAWTLSIAYAILIFILSSFPYSPPQPSPLKEISPAFKHIVEYAIFGFLLLASFRSSKKTRKSAFWFAILVAAIYGMTDEIHQLFVPYRTADILDVLADAAGAFFGVLFATPPHPCKKELN